MKRLTKALALVWVLALLAPCSFAGHALDSPIEVTNPGDFFVSGNSDFDGTSVCDGVWTFNAAPLFVAGMSTSGDLAVSGAAAVGGNMIVTGTLTVLDTLIIAGELNGGIISFPFTHSSDNITADTYLDIGSMACAADRGATVPSAGDFHSYAVRVQVDAAGGTDSRIECDINGVLAFSDTLTAGMDTGWYTNEKVFEHSEHMFSAGDYISVEWNELGVWQIDVPQLVLIMHLDE